MADFYGTSRSNYFRVKDEGAFLNFIGHVPGLVHELDDKDPALHMIWGDDGFGCFPNYAVIAKEEMPSCPWAADGSRGVETIEDSGDGESMDVQFSLPELLSQFLADGEVAVLIQAGAEKLRYISGWAVAIDNTGKKVSINLSDIYELAVKKFVKLQGQISTAEY